MATRSTLDTWKQLWDYYYYFFASVSRHFSVHQHSCINLLLLLMIPKRCFRSCLHTWTANLQRSSCWLFFPAGLCVFDLLHLDTISYFVCMVSVRNHIFSLVFFKPVWSMKDFVQLIVLHAFYFVTTLFNPQKGFIWMEMLLFLGEWPYFNIFPSC